MYIAVLARMASLLSCPILYLQIHWLIVISPIEQAIFWSILGVHWYTRWLWWLRDAIRHDITMKMPCQIWQSELPPCMPCRELPHSLGIQWLDPGTMHTMFKNRLEVASNMWFISNNSPIVLSLHIIRSWTRLVYNIQSFPTHWFLYLFLKNCCASSNVWFPTYQASQEMNKIVLEPS